MSFKDLTHFTLALAGTQVYAASWNSMGAWAEHTRQRHKAAAKRCDFAGKIIGTQFGTYGKCRNARSKWSFEIALNMFGKIIELHVFWIVFSLAFFDVQFSEGRS